MTKIKTRPFDVANYLKSEEDIAEYLNQVLEESDPTELAAALGAIARARSMTKLAEDTGLSRESLYKSLSGERAPSSETLFKVIKALGLEIRLTPKLKPADPSGDHEYALAA
jgi:probable addiction module antidote protein